VEWSRLGDISLCVILCHTVLIGHTREICWSFGSPVVHSLVVDGLVWSSEICRCVWCLYFHSRGHLHVCRCVGHVLFTHVEGVLSEKIHTHVLVNFRSFMCRKLWFLPDCLLEFWFWIREIPSPSPWDTSPVNDLTVMTIIYQLSCTERRVAQICIDHMSSDVTVTTVFKEVLWMSWQNANTTLRTCRRHSSVFSVAPSSCICLILYNKVCISKTVSFSSSRQFPIAHTTRLQSPDTPMLLCVCGRMTYSIHGLWYILPCDTHPRHTHTQRQSLCVVMCLSPKQRRIHPLLSRQMWRREKE
jgi:hypothetical protein